jgi:hypothetical protein
MCFNFSNGQGYTGTGRFGDAVYAQRTFLLMSVWVNKPDTAIMWCEIQKVRCGIYFQRSSDNQQRIGL